MEGKLFKLGSSLINLLYFRGNLILLMILHSRGLIIVLTLVTVVFVQSSRNVNKYSSVKLIRGGQIGMHMTTYMDYSHTLSD